MCHMMQENLSLCIGRAGQVVGLEKPWNIVFCSDSIEDFNLFYRGGNVNFPLYLYPDIDKKNLFSHKRGLEKKQHNISPSRITALAQVYERGLTPEEIFYYIYAVLYSNIYRTKYAEFLRIDFPRIPFTKNYKLFCKMGEYGKRLVDLHLLNSSELDQPTAKFQGKGENVVEKVRYNKERVHINNDRYFEGVTEEVWEYQIGGYQVCEKWLKDHKGRILSLDEIRHYCRVVTAIERTIEIQKEVDGLYPEIEKETIALMNLNKNNFLGMTSFPV